MNNLPLLCVFLFGIAVSTFYTRLSKPAGSFWASLGARQHALSFFGLPPFKAKKLHKAHVELLDRFEIEVKYPETTWQRRAYDAFADQMLAKSPVFPCIYGTKGLKANELSFQFLDSEDLCAPAILQAAANGLLAYHALAATLGKNTSLVLIAAPPTQTRSVDDYHHLFWRFLKDLRALDPKPWPADTPTDTNARRWCFNFDGIPSFTGVMTPAHESRRSRYSSTLCLIYQPRYIFDILFVNEKSRLAATTTVRGLVDKYDEIPHSPDISDYARPGTTESLQYFLLDENVPAVCPYETLEEV